jgi:hypothetical protein
MGLKAGAPAAEEDTSPVTSQLFRHRFMFTLAVLAAQATPQLVASMVAATLAPGMPTKVPVVGRQTLELQRRYLTAWSWPVVAVALEDGSAVLEHLAA